MELLLIKRKLDNSSQNSLFYMRLKQNNEMPNGLKIARDFKDLPTTLNPSEFEYLCKIYKVPSQIIQDLHLFCSHVLINNTDYYDY